MITSLLKKRLICLKLVFALLFTISPPYCVAEASTIAPTLNYEKSLIIDGVEYDANEQCGSYALGWHYYPNKVFNSGAQYASQLNVYSNYSGKPIEVSQSVYINMFKSMSGADGSPAITVTGNVCISVYMWKDRTNNPVIISGCLNAPAIKASGEIRINVANAFVEENEEGMKLILKGGDSRTPALVGNTVLNIGRVFMAGTDKNNMSLVAVYSNESYVEVTDTWQYQIELYGETTVPEVPVHSAYTFVGWTSITHPNTWYMPGDSIYAGKGLKLEAHYIDNNETSTAIVIDGQGGHTSFGSKYYVEYASSSDLVTYELPECPFTYNYNIFEEYNYSPMGDGSSLYPGHNLTVSALVHKLYTQWTKVYKYIPNAGVSIECFPNLNSITITLSSQWCENNGIKSVVVSTFYGRKMLKCLLDTYKEGNYITFTLNYSDNTIPICKVFSLDENYNPTCSDITCDISKLLE